VRRGASPVRDVGKTVCATSPDGMATATAVYNRHIDGEENDRVNANVVKPG
jgi:hypothetical protein